MSAESLPVIGNLGEHAINYASDGFEIFPCDKHSKRPMAAVTSGPSQYSATTNIDQIAEWWTRWPDALIGHRFDEHTISLDIDPRHNGNATWHLFRETHDIPKPTTRSHLSGREDNGGHLWFQRPPGKLTIARLDKWAEEHGTGHATKGGKWVGGIDLLHRNHRYTILPPSPHPETGKPYRWNIWGDIEEAHPAIVEILVDNRPPPPPRQPKKYDGDSIADWYSATYGLAELLHRHGWSLRQGDGDSDGSAWQHPYATSPVSATVRHGCLFVYSPNTPFDVTAPGDPAGVTPFKAFTILEHGGDGKAAARAARTLKDGDKITLTKPTNHIIEAAPATPTPPNIDPETGEVIEDVEDDGPIPLDNVDLPAFPLDVLPPWIRSEVVACSESLSVPIEIPAGLALVALSTACAGKIDVDGINYHQPTNLWLSIIAASGVGKSPAADRMLGPLYDLDEQLRVEAAEEVARSAAEAAAIEEQVTAAKALLKKDPTSDAARRAMADAMFAQTTHEAIRPHRLFMDDHTPEALSVVLAEQRTHRMAILSPEGAGLFSTMTGTRYKTNDLPEVPGVYLKSWGGEPLPIDRKGSDPIMVKRPILTVGVLVQPAVVDRLAMTPMIAEQGALARFLWIVAADNVGTRDRRRRRNAARQSPEYVERLVGMARRCLSWQMPTTITATEEAADHLDDVNDERERRMGLGGDLDAYRAVEAKLVGYQWRLAALLAVAWDDHRDDGISVERARQAEALADYFLAHSIAVHRRAGLGEHGGTLRAVAGYMTKHAGEELDWRDFQLKMRGVGDMETLRHDIEQLIELRWLRSDEPVDISAIGNRGLPNPVLHIDARLRATLRNGGMK